MLKALAVKEFDGKVLLLGPRDSSVVAAVRALGENLGIAMLPTLATPFGTDALRDSVSHQLERLECVLTQKLAREHCQDTNNTTFDDERVAGKGYHSLFFCPLRIAYMGVVFYVIFQVGRALHCDHPKNEQSAQS